MPFETKSIPCTLSGPFPLPPAESKCCAHWLPLELGVCTCYFANDLWCLERASHPEVPSPSLCIACIDLSLRQSPIALRPSPSRVKKSAVHVVVTVEVWGYSLIGLVTILFHAALCIHCPDATNSHSVRVRSTSFVKFQILATINYRLCTLGL